MAAIKWLNEDGFLNVQEFTALAREIDKLAIKANLKPNNIMYTAKVIPKFDLEKQKKDAVMFGKKRAQVVKARRSMPAAGSRTKMVVILREYKGFETLEEYDDFKGDIAAAKKAIERHTLKATKEIERLKLAGVKTREKAAAEFDKAINELSDLVGHLSVDDDSIELATGQTRMGKTAVLRIGKHFYAIGKADAAKFEATIASNEVQEEAPAPTKRVAARSTKTAPAAPARSRKLAAAPASPKKSRR